MPEAAVEGQLQVDHTTPLMSMDLCGILHRIRSVLPRAFHSDV